MNQVQPQIYINSVPTEVPLLAFGGVFAIAMLIGWLVGGNAICRYTGLTRWNAALLWLLAIVLSISFLFYERQVLRGHYDSTGIYEKFTLFMLVCVVLLPLLALPFVVRLYGKWVGGHLTDAEKLPGMNGVRAWLGVGNIICAVLLPICLWRVFGVSFFGAGALMFGLLLAYPLLNMASHSARPAPPLPVEDLSNEREKVLQLLEDGRITADESAELLNALSHSAPRPPKPVTEMNPQRKMVLLGAALLLIGFFLPWFSFNPGQEASRMFTQMQQSMNPQIPMNGAPVINYPQFNTTFRIGGGDVAHGLGWWILLLGIGAAVLPFFATNLDSQLQKKAIMAALGIGAVILLYLFTNNLRYISIGVLFVLAGYVLELVGTLQERPAAH